MLTGVVTAPSRISQVLPYMPHLLNIRRFFESQCSDFKSRRRGFPKGYCHVTAGVVSHVTGLEAVAGLYSPHRSLVSQDHGWNFDRQKRLYVDLTGDQFGDFEPIMVASQEDERFDAFPSLREWEKSMFLSQVVRIRQITKRALVCYYAWKMASG